MVDAVAFACCCSPPTLRVARLSDVQSTETRHPAEACRLLFVPPACMWRLLGARCMQSLNQLSAPCCTQVHLTMSCMQRRHPDCIVSCMLTADGTRAYKLDGKNRTAREIKVQLSSIRTKIL
jgi:hypothetical protein